MTAVKDKLLGSDGKSNGAMTKAIGSMLAKPALNLAGAAGKRLLSSATDKVSGVTDRLTQYAEGGGGPGLLSALTGKDGGMGAKGGKKLKVTNIVEQIDVGVPVHLAYDQWTRFTDFPEFMKKVESVEQESDEKLKWKAQVFWSHRAWESTIMEQVPDRRIVWRSDGEKGTVDGAVTFHEIAPELTRIMLILEYHPKGFFEHTGNLWRAQGRRARLELKHFARQVMTQAILHPDEIEGWRGEIHDGQVSEAEEAEPEEAEPEEAKAEGAEEEPRDRGEREQESGQRRGREGRRGGREGEGRESRPARRPSGGEERRPTRPSGRGDESARRPARPKRERESRGAEQ